MAGLEIGGMMPEYFYYYKTVRFLLPPASCADHIMMDF